jgi:hypothetical protein
MAASHHREWWCHTGQAALALAMGVSWAPLPLVVMPRECAHWAARSLLAGEGPSSSSSSIKGQVCDTLQQSARAERSMSPPDLRQLICCICVAECVVGWLVNVGVVGHVPMPMCVQDNVQARMEAQAPLLLLLPLCCCCCRCQGLELERPQ